MSSFEKPENTSNYFARYKDQPNFARKVKRTLILTLVLCFIGTATAFGFWLKSVGIFGLTEKNLNSIVQYKHFDNSVVFDRNNRLFACQAL